MNRWDGDETHKQRRALLSWGNPTHISVLQYGPEAPKHQTVSSKDSTAPA